MPACLLQNSLHGPHSNKVAKEPMEQTHCYSFRTSFPNHHLTEDVTIVPLQGQQQTSKIPQMIIYPRWLTEKRKPAHSYFSMQRRTRKTIIHINTFQANFGLSQTITSFSIKLSFTSKLPYTTMLSRTIPNCIQSNAFHDHQTTPIISDL